MSTKTHKKLERFAEHAFKGEACSFVLYESAGEIRREGKEDVAYLQLYNGHFWNAGTGHGQLSYLGPTPEIAGMMYHASETDDTEEFEDFPEHSRKILEDIFDDGGSALPGVLGQMMNELIGHEERPPLEERVKKYNPRPMQPSLGKPIMNQPKEWDERLRQELSKWEVIDPVTMQRRPAYPDKPRYGFRAFCTRAREILRTEISYEVFSHDENDETTEYACQLDLGYDKDGDLISFYFVKVGNAYYNSNAGLMLEVLGVDPIKAAQFWCHCEGWWNPEPEDMGKDDFDPEFDHDHDYWGDIDEVQHDNRNTVYWPSEWTDMIKRNQTEAALYENGRTKNP